MGDNNDCSDVLDAFKYFCQWCRTLDHDTTIEKIMDSVHAFRDGNDGMSFKEALNKALMTRKYLIYRALEDSEESSDEADDIDIWKELLEESDCVCLDVFERLRKHIVFRRALKRDSIFQSVIEIVKD